MKTIKTLKQAIKLDKGQLTAQQLINGRLYTSKGWESFKIDFELKKVIADNVSAVLGGHTKTKKSVFNSILYGTPQHWGLDRIILKLRQNPKDRRKTYVSFQYVAGQDYTHELNQIRTALK